MFERLPLGSLPGLDSRGIMVLDLACAGMTADSCHSFGMKFASDGIRICSGVVPGNLSSGNHPGGLDG